MSDVNTWSTTAGSNNSAAPDGWPENMNYSDVNNCAREMMSAIAEWYADLNATITSTGSSDAYVVAANRDLSTYADGMCVRFKANHTNSGAATLNLDGGGVTAIVREDNTALAANEILQDHFYEVKYDGTLSKFILFPCYSAGLEQWTTKAAPSGVVVGTTDAQTLTNKTLTSPTINSGALSGTFSGDATFSGNITFSGTMTGAGIGEFKNTSIAISSDDSALANDDETSRDNVGIGVNAGNEITTGDENVFIGVAAGRYGTTGDYNIGIGSQAGQGDSSSKLTGTDNICLGRQSGLGLTTGLDNICLGRTAGDSVTTGDGNILIGYAAGAAHTTGDGAVIVGYNAGPVLTGTGATVVGYQAGNETTSATNATLIGRDAGRYLTTGTRNTAVGQLALKGNAVSKLTGGSNVGVGYQSGDALTTGSGNTFTGVDSGGAMTTGTNNTFIGKDAGVAHVSGSNNTSLGYQADASSTSASNEFTLGNSSVSTLRCQQTSITALSDERDKANIKDLDVGIDFINSLRPVNFTWDMRDGSRTDDVVQNGFIAQEVGDSICRHAKGKLDDLIFHATDERIEFKQGDLVPAMVQAIKDLSAEIDILKGQLSG